MGIEDDKELRKKFNELLDYMRTHGYDPSTKNLVPSPDTSDNEEVKRSPGRPKGSFKRKGGSTTVTLSIGKADKEWLRETAAADGVTLSDLVIMLIDKERARRERSTRQRGPYPQTRNKIIKREEF